MSHQVRYIVTNLNHTDSLTSKDCHVVLAGMPTVPIGGSPLRCGGTVGVAGGGRCQSPLSRRPAFMPLTSVEFYSTFWPLLANDFTPYRTRPGDTALQRHPSPRLPRPDLRHPGWNDLREPVPHPGYVRPGQLIFLPHHASPDGCWPR